MSRRKPRPDPYTEGFIADIYKWFFGRLIFLKPETHTIKEWLEQLFHYKEREIVRWKATKPFRMPGLFYVTSNTKVQGVGYRDVEVGTVLWVRTDTTTPDAVDVECLMGQGSKDCVFSLNSSEWGLVQLSCEQAERRPS